MPDLAQRSPPIVAGHAHRARDALRRAEQVAENGNRATGGRLVIAHGMLKKQRGAAGLQHAIAQFRHLELRIDGRGDALQFSQRFELGQEIAEIAVGHGGIP